MRPLWRADTHPVIIRVAKRIMVDSCAVALGLGVFVLVWLIFTCEG